MSEFNLRELADRIASLRVSGSSNGAIIGCSGYHETTDEYEFYKIATTGDHVTAKDIADALVVFPKLVEGNTSLLARAEKAEAKVKELDAMISRESFDRFLVEQLKDPEIARAYAKAIIDENILFDIIKAKSERIAELESSLAALREQMRWIPVGERLPEIDALILTFDSDGDIKSDFRSFNPICDNVTHWRPIDLPEVKEC